VRPRTILGALLTGLVLLSGCTDGSDAEPPAATDIPTRTQPIGDSLRKFYEQSVNWRACNSFECASIDVPLDYSDPTGPAIELALLRRRADERADRIGSLLVNPGGPGVSGIGYAENSEYFFNEPILDRYDIVGWDPRGVGDSTAVECMSDEQTDVYLATDGTPDNAAEIRDVLRLQRDFTRSCEQNSGKLLARIGTMDSARDIDIIREVLGEGRTDYFGASYGTELGATYADLFPERVGRMVLDGALDPSVSSQQLGLGQLRGFQRAVSAFIDDCIARDGCPIGPSADQAEQQIISLLESIDASPLSSDSARDVTESLATTGMIAAMYDQGSGWPALRLGLDQALQGDGTVLLALADSYSERNPDGTFASNVNDAFPAISCTDRPGSSSVASIKAAIPRYERISPIFGRGFAWAGSSCANWPVDEGAFPQRLVGEGSAPILVVGTTRDPATPYEWSIGLAKQLDAGVLLSRDGDGHTAYNAGNACIDDYVEEYLLDGVVPSNRTLC
jgi:pimeloyl-ACP methyl ester carboxylesterase